MILCSRRGINGYAKDWSTDRKVLHSDTENMLQEMLCSSGRGAFLSTQMPVKSLRRSKLALELKRTLEQMMKRQQVASMSL